MKKIKTFIKLILHLCKVFVVKSAMTIRYAIFTFLYTDLRNHISRINGDGTLTILANGPSLVMDLEQINFSEGEFSVVNDFYKSPWYEKIKPSYHVLADPLYFTKDEDIQPFVDAVKWNMKLFVPYSAWKRMDILRHVPSQYIEVVPYHINTYYGFDCFRDWTYRHGLSMPIPQNVLVPSIFNAINMGYKEIRLYGVDHSWTESIRMNDKNQVCLTDSHFYDNEQAKLLPWKKCGVQYKMHEILRDLAQMFDSYHQIRKYADSLHCHIVNMTKNSYIDAFDRC